MYRKLIHSYEQQLQTVKATSTFLSNIRLLIVVIGIGLGLYLYSIHAYVLCIFILLSILIAFIITAAKHAAVLQQLKYTAALKEINEQSLRRLSSEWKESKDTGEEYQDDEHLFSGDLDLFGRSSLFQWINTTNTFLGRELLKQSLLTPLRNITELQVRQKAIMELGQKLNWRQKFQAEGKIVFEKAQNPASLFAWSTCPSIFNNPWTVWIIVFSPFITIASLVASILISSISYWIPFILFFVQGTVLLIKSKKTYEPIHTIDTHKQPIQMYSQLLALFEKEKFESVYLKRLQQSLKNASKVPAYKQLQKLEIIADMISFRRSQFYLPFNILTLWDFQCILALEYWKSKFGKHLSNTLHVIGEVESLCSFAVIGHDHPQWVLPSFTENKLCLKAKALGHPLIPSNLRVCNDLYLTEKIPIGLITGSNMSGKSTFLRSLGINLILAYTGAPVCAQEFHCSFMEIYTSMRTKDNLEKNISSFYAELLRIKAIIDAAKKGKPVFFLLDEIFKGTNSGDRHIGAKTLIKHLYKARALGLVSTHDLELGALGMEPEKTVENYHFEEYYKNEQIYFDYTLRRGISSSLNALYLMKQIGIEIP